MISSPITPPFIETSPIDDRDRECASVDLLRLRAATFEFGLERERQRRLETGKSMPQEWVASLQREREEVLDQIQRYESPADKSAASSTQVQSLDFVTHAPVPCPRLPAPAPYPALGSDDGGRISVPPRVHGSGHTHRLPATVHPLPGIRPFRQPSDYHASDLNVTDSTQSLRNRKREIQERNELEGSSNKRLAERAAMPINSCSPQAHPRPFLLPKSSDDKLIVSDSPAERRLMNTARRHHGITSPLSPYRPTTPTPLSPPNLSNSPLGISDSGRRSARGWYSTTPRPNKGNLHRSLLSPSRSDHSRTLKSKATVLDDNDQPVFTEDDDPFTHEASSMERTPTTTFNAQGLARRTDAFDLNDYIRPASAAAYVSRSSRDRPFEASRSTTTPLQIAKICKTLMNIFRDRSKYKQFLSYRDRVAQSLLNFLQTLLDYSQLEEGFRGILFVALVRLARKSNLYPECFALTDVTREGEDPVTDGRYGDIYKAYFQGRLVCLKVVRMYEKSDQASLTKAFFREAVLWGQLSHINVLPFYGISRLDDTRQRIGLVSPWMEHGNVNEFLGKNPDADRRLLVMDVAAGMSHLCSHGVTHGDLKGSNILVTESKRACLADFGFSSVMDSQGLKTASLSSATSEGGTVRFQAPELINPQFEGSRSPASDVYAFALVCYEIFTGTVPFCHIPNSYTVMFRVANGERPPRLPGSLYTNRGLNDAMWTLMEDCWKHIPADRPTASQIVYRLPRVPDNRPSVPWSRLRASAGRGLANDPSLLVVETLRVLETNGVSYFQV